MSLQLLHHIIKLIGTVYKHMLVIILSLTLPCSRQWFLTHFRVVSYSFLLSILCIFLLFCFWFIGLTVYHFTRTFNRTKSLWFLICNAMHFASTLYFFFFFFFIYGEFCFLLSCTSVVGTLTTLASNSQHNCSQIFVISEIWVSVRDLVHLLSLAFMSLACALRL